MRPLRFSYKLPLALVFGLVCLCLVSVLGSFGFLGDSFKVTGKTQIFGCLMTLAIAGYLALSPRDRQVQISDAGVTLYNVLLPPFVSVSFSWDEVLEVHSSDKELLFVTRRGHYKLEHWLCSGDFEFSSTARHYVQARRQVEEKWQALRRERKLRRWHLQNQRRASQDS